MKDTTIKGIGFKCEECATVLLKCGLLMTLCDNRLRWLRIGLCVASKIDSYYASKVHWRIGDLIGFQIGIGVTEPRKLPLVSFASASF